MKFSILHIMALTAVIAMQIQSIPAMVIGIIGSMIVIFGGIFSLMVASLLPRHTPAEPDTFWPGFHRKSETILIWATLNLGVMLVFMWQALP